MPAMDEKSESTQLPWHKRYGRDKYLHPRTLLFPVVMYIATYIIVAITCSILERTVPYLPWIEKPYVSKDPPPLVTAFFCANLTGGFFLFSMPLVYLLGPDRETPRSRRKRMEANSKEDIKPRPSSHPSQR
jgi:hypothetical protein